MAVYKIFPEKDTTIYSLFPFMNTGIDEILEATTTTFGLDVNPQVSRALLKFSTDQITSIINNTIGGFNNLGDARLKMFIATAEGLNTDTVLEFFPISGSWNMGTGRYLDDPITPNGASWQWSDFSGSKRWPINNFSPSGYVTGSWDPTGSAGGGTWWFKNPDTNTIFNITQSLNYSDTKDVTATITPYITAWYSASINSGTLHNEGILIKQTPPNEFVYSEYKATELKYFSIDTHTIYPPYLEFRWVDYSFNTGSSTNTIITTPQLYISLDNNNGFFRSGSVHKFRINSRPKYPTRVFQTSSLYTKNYYLPTSSYYAIKDLDTNEFIIDFDTNYTQISADNESSYFTIYMNGLEPERYYQILIKVLIGGETLILDNNYYFKVING
jgi:hypothetical protein